MSNLGMKMGSNLTIQNTRQAIRFISVGCALIESAIYYARIDWLLCDLSLSNNFAVQQLVCLVCPPIVEMKRLPPLDCFVP